MNDDGSYAVASMFERPVRQNRYLLRGFPCPGHYTPGQLPMPAKWEKLGAVPNQMYASANATAVRHFYVFVLHWAPETRQCTGTTRMSWEESINRPRIKGLCDGVRQPQAGAPAHRVSKLQWSTGGTVGSRGRFPTVPRGPQAGGWWLRRMPRQRRHQPRGQGRPA